MPETDLSTSFTVAYLYHSPSHGCNIIVWAVCCESELTDGSRNLNFYNEDDKNCPDCSRPGKVGSTHLATEKFLLHCDPKPGRVRVLRQGQGSSFMPVH